MKRNQLLLIAAALVLFIGILMLGRKITPPPSVPSDSSPAVSDAAFDPRNATYLIDGRRITLVNGASEMDAAPGSAVKVVTRIWDEPLEGDLNGDGKDDAVFILTQQLGGSGTFYYVAAALRTAEGTQGTNGVLLGDRIAPQNVIIQQNGTFAVNYAQRNKGEPMTARPSMGTTKYLKVSGTEIVVAAPTLP